jgi:signal transduction histidine kinase
VPLIKSVFQLRSENRLRTRLELRAERAYAVRVMPGLALVYLSFTVVDLILSPEPGPWVYLGIRLGVICLSDLSYRLARGRLPYSLRTFLCSTPYVYSVEALMIWRNLTLTPYFSGIALCVATGSIVFPNETKKAWVTQILLMSPVVIWFALHPLQSNVDQAGLLLMSAGIVLVCAVHSAQAFRDVESLSEKEMRLELEVRNRQKIIQAQVAETVGARMALQQKELEAEHNGQIALLAAQVAHDVRSPLAVLKTVVHDKRDAADEDGVLIRVAVERITGIVNTLLAQRYKPLLPRVRLSDQSDASTLEPITPVAVCDVVKSIIHQKRAQFRAMDGCTIIADYREGQAAELVLAQRNELQRLLSNLINNAVEALDQKLGVVTVVIHFEPSFAVLTIQDNGKGIPAEVLPSLMQRGRSFGKPAGSGLGLYHAKTCVESWGGSILLRSQIGVGTSISVRIPRAG